MQQPSGSPKRSPMPSYEETAPDPPTRSQSVGKKQPVETFGGEESAMTSTPLPVKELEYDDRIDYAADVSVMESLGGPSLLVERARHENAVSAGADHAAQTKQLENQDPELADLVEAHGEGFSADPGLTKEETAFRDPYKFYEHAVRSLLQDNEPEKVRLLNKLMAKYRGRERHLINKLSARYKNDAKQQTVQAQIERKVSASVSGMEKIHEGEDEEASSPLNDPTRANIAAIEAVKKRVEDEDAKDNGGQRKASPAEDGWPPAMDAPWGTSQPTEHVPTKEPPTNTHTISAQREEPPSPVRQHVDNDEGSYSDAGSSYSGESVDGTSPAIIAQVSELLNYVYGKTSVAGQIDRVSTIMRAYEGREAVLLELLETKALIKANADSSRDTSDLPPSLRNSQGGAKTDGNGAANTSQQNDVSMENVQSPSPVKKHFPPQTPVSALSDSSMARDDVETIATSATPKSPASVNHMVSQQTPTSSPAPQSHEKLEVKPSKSGGLTVDTVETKKKKKGIFGGMFGGKKGKKGKGASGGGFPELKTSPRKGKTPKNGKKGQPLIDVRDDRSI